MKAAFMTALFLACVSAKANPVPKKVTTSISGKTAVEKALASDEFKAADDAIALEKNGDLNSVRIIKPTEKGGPLAKYRVRVVFTYKIADSNEICRTEIPLGIRLKQVAGGITVGEVYVVSAEVTSGCGETPPVNLSK